MKLSASRALLLGALVMLLVPAGASAQATRTWISGVGDDVNPCSRTAPCKTWAGAMPKTAAGGEINALDRGGFGPLTGQATITKSITIVGDQRATANQSTGTVGAIIQAGPNDRVVLRNINMNGHNSGTDGIRIVSAGSVRIEDSKIHGFSNGINFSPSNALTTKVTLVDSAVHHNRSAGINVAPTASSIARITVRRTDVDDNLNGVVLNAAGGRAAATISRSAITDSGNTGGDPATTGIAIKASGANAIARLMDNEIFGNLCGLMSVSGGQILSAGDNVIFGNNSLDGAPTGPMSKM